MLNSEILDEIYTQNNPKSFREFWKNLKDSKNKYQELFRMTVQEIRLFYDNKKVE